MLKNLFFLIFVLSATVGLSQEIDRIRVQGKIHVPEGEDAEGISVYNSSSQKGTITDENGQFVISVAENDRLRIFALQYQPFTAVVDKAIIDRKEMNIYVNPAITRLEEVIVRPYDLSGNIRADVEKIPTYYADRNWDLSYSAMEFEYGFIVDPQTKISGNAADQALSLNYLENAVDVLAVMGGVANLLFPNRKKSSSNLKKAEEEVLLSNNLQQRFSRQFVKDNFDIPEKEALDFLFYVQDEGFEKDLLKPENELELMQFLNEQSEKFKEKLRD